LDDSPKKPQTAPPDACSKNGKLLNFFVPGVLAARIAKLPGLHTLGVLLLVLRRRVVAVFAIAALQRNDFSHDLIPSLALPSICEGKIVTR
jgi:hypothetical protein